MNRKSMLIFCLMAFAIANPSKARSIVFAGLVWDVRIGGGGPGNGCWSDSSEAVWVDAEGLHLQMTTDENGNWCQAQVTARAFARYGEHRFQVIKDLDQLDDDLVLAMYLYRTDQIEIDLEVTKSFNPDHDKGWYVVHGCNFVNGRGPSASFDFSMSGTYSTHKFNWLGGGVEFETYHGHCEVAPCGGIISGWSYVGVNTPADMHNLRPNISLWRCVGCFGDDELTPASGPHEVTIADYSGPTVPADVEEGYVATVVADAGLRGGSFGNDNFGGVVDGDAEQRLMGYGNDDSIYLSNGDAPLRSALTFDLSGIPEDREVAAAFMTLSFQAATGASSCNGTPKQLADYCYEIIDVEPYVGPWSESSITWNSRPNVDSTATVRGCFPESGFNPTIDIPVTPLVQAWLSGSRENNGLELSVPSWEAEYPMARYYLQREGVGIAPSLTVWLVRGLFRDGFESGDTSAWGFP